MKISSFLGALVLAGVTFFLEVAFVSFTSAMGTSTTGAGSVTAGEVSVFASSVVTIFSVTGVAGA